MDQSTDGMSAEGCGILASLPYSSIQGLLRCFRAELLWMKRIHCTLPYPLWVHECLMIAPAFSIEREGRRFITAPLKLDVHMWCNTASEIRTGAIHITTGRSLLRSLEESISNLPLLYHQHQVGTCHYSSVLSQPLACPRVRDALWMKNKTGVCIVF